jgi:hypothetical protein
LATNFGHQLSITLDAQLFYDCLAWFWSLHCGLSPKK